MTHHSSAGIAAVLAMFLLPPIAGAVEPESGIYWSNGRPGEGLLVERQGEQVALVLYTYSATGEPEFYVAGGPLQEGGMTEPVGWTEGYFPLHHVRATLFRTTDGPRFNSVDQFTTDNGRTLTSAPVGVIDATFQYNNYVEVAIRLDEIPENAHPTQRQFVTAGYSRTSFGFSGLGVDTIASEVIQNPQPCWHDLSGTWAFADSGAEQRDIWRFDFELDEVSPPVDQMACPVQAGDSQVLVYRDSSRGAVMRCVSAPSGDPLDGRLHIAGCEVTQEGADGPLFFFYQQDIGLKRMVGSRGAFPQPDSGVLRTPQRVIGLRVD